MTDNEIDASLSSARARVGEAHANALKALNTQFSVGILARLVYFSSASDDAQEYGL